MLESKISENGADQGERVCDNCHDDEVSLTLTFLSTVIEGNELSSCFIRRFVQCSCL